MQALTRWNSGVAQDVEGGNYPSAYFTIVQFSGRRAADNLVPTIMIHAQGGVA